MRFNNRNDDNTMYILSECAVNPADINIDVLSESSVEINGVAKKCITIDTVLQSFDVMNWNRRIYPKSVVMSAIDNDGMIQNDIKRGQWIGEYGHPIDLSPHRQMIIYPPTSSHRILNYRCEGNLLKAHVQTLANDMGTQLMNCILQGVPAAFSLRSLGSVDMATRRVKAPLKVICYDAVYRPSHIEAYQTEILSEAATSIYSPNKNSSFFDVMTESAVCEPIHENIDQILSYAKERSRNVQLIADMFKLDKIECSLNETGTRMNIKLDEETKVNIPIESAIHMQYSDILSNYRKYR